MNHEEAIRLSTRIETNVSTLNKLSKEQIESVVRLADFYKVGRITLSRDIWSDTYILFMLGTAGLNGLIEDDGSVHT